MTRLKFLLFGILRKMGQSRRSKYQNTARNEHYIMAKSRRFYRGLRRILRVKKWRRSENFDGVGILRICGVTARSHIRLPTSTFTRYVLYLVSHFDVLSGCVIGVGDNAVGVPGVMIKYMIL